MKYVCERPLGQSKVHMRVRGKLGWLLILMAQQEVNGGKKVLNTRQRGQCERRQNTFCNNMGRFPHSPIRRLHRCFFVEENKKTIV